MTKANKKEFVEGYIPEELREIAEVRAEAKFKSAHELTVDLVSIMMGQFFNSPAVQQMVSRNELQELVADEMKKHLKKQPVTSEFDDNYARCMRTQAYKLTNMEYFMLTSEDGMPSIEEWMTHMRVKRSAENPAEMVFVHTPVIEPAPVHTPDPVAEETVTKRPYRRLNLETLFQIFDEYVAAGGILTEPYKFKAYNETAYKFVLRQFGDREADGRKQRGEALRKAIEAYLKTK